MPSLSGRAKVAQQKFVMHFLENRAGLIDDPFIKNGVFVPKHGPKVPSICWTF